MAGGRPTLYRPEMCEVVVKLMKDGASKYEVVRELNICLDTLYEYCKKHEKFAEAVKKGESYSQGWWEQVGRQNVNNKNFNAVLWYMNMKNRFGWKDKQDEGNSEAKQTLMQKIIDKL